MSELDKRLEDIIFPGEMQIESEWGTGDEKEAIKYTREKVDDIKQVFIDAGWTKPIGDAERENLIAAYAAAEYMKQETMTGQEWYARFMSELNKLSEDSSESQGGWVTYSLMDEAADKL